MTNEERIALILDIKGVESVNALNKSLDDQKKELKQLEFAWKGGEIAAKDFLQQQEQLQGQIQETTSLVMRLKGTGAGGANGMGVMAMSYAFQDFTSQIRNGFGPALASIQNNIPGMLVGTGLSNPMIAAISAISVAIGLIAPAIIEAFGGKSKKAIEEAEEKLKEFAAHVKKVHEEFEKMREKPTAPEEEFQENLKAIFEAPGNADLIRKAIMTSMKPQIPIGMTDEEIRKAAEAETEKLIGAPTRGSAEYARQVALRSEPLISQRTVLRAQEAEQRGVEAENIMKQVLTPGPAQATALMKLKGVPLPVGLARELEGVTPEAMAASDAEDRKFNEGLERAKEGTANRKMHRKNEREADAEAKRKEAELKRQRDAHDDHVEREEQAGLEAMDRIGETARRRVDRDRIQDMRKQQQRDRAAGMRGMRQQERELNQRDDDIARGREEIRHNIIQSAKDRGESRENIAALIEIARQAAMSDAAEKEFWRRERQKAVEAVQGGGMPN